MKNEQEPLSDRIIKVAEQYGFNLEFKTYRELVAAGFTCQLNEILQYGNNFIEVDLIARKEIPPLRLLIECKGAHKDTILLLIKGSENRTLQDKFDSSVTRYEITPDFRMPIYNIESESALYTISGDFFINKTEGELKKSSKNDERNNFYKAQQQILDAVNLYSHTPIDSYDPQFQDRIPHYLVPLIVTNADIWIIDYNHDDPKPMPYAGALHRVPINDLTKFCLLAGNKRVNTFTVPIVNYNYLNVVLNELAKPGACNCLHQISLDFSFK